MENIISAFGYIMVTIFMVIFFIVTLYLSVMIIVYITSDMIELGKYIRKYTAEGQEPTHIIWATGGSMVPEAEMQSYYEKGK